MIYIFSEGCLRRVVQQRPHHDTKTFFLCGIYVRPINLPSHTSDRRSELQTPTHPPTPTQPATPTHVYPHPPTHACTRLTARPTQPCGHSWTSSWGATATGTTSGSGTTPTTTSASPSSSVRVNFSARFTCLVF